MEGKLKEGENRKTHNITLFFLLCLIVILILSSILQNYLLKENIEFRNNVIIARIIVTWFIIPFSIVLSFFRLIKTKLIEAKVITAINITEGLILLIILVIFMIRILGFYLFENRKEQILDNGYIMVYSENFQEQQTKYYKPVSRFLYMYISEWPDVELLLQMQRKYGEDVAQVGYNNSGYPMFSKIVYIEGQSLKINFLISDKETMDDNYFTSVLEGYNEYFWSDVEQEPSLIENNSSSLSITLISFNKDILKSMTKNVYDWLIFLKINLDNNVKDYFNQNINSIELVSEQTGEFFTIYLGKDVLEYSEEEIQRIILQQTERIK